jgi:hypothetical protein
MPYGRRLCSKASLMLVAAMLVTLLLAPLALAGKEGVYISGQTYFTLEQVSFSSGTDSSLLKFVLRLHNGSDQDVDFNYFGARVTDSQGRSYSAAQVNKQNARVLPGQEQDFQFTARTASSVQAGDLNVTLFAWDYSQSNYMRDLGSLSVAAAIQEGGNAVSETTVSLSQVDSALSTDASVSFHLDQSYRVYQANNWNLYTDLTINNPGSSAVTIPAGLKYRLTNPKGQLFGATVVQGGDQPLLPGASRKLIIQTILTDEVQGEGAWTLELYKGAAGNESLLGTIGLGNEKMSSPIGAVVTLTGPDATKQFSAVVESATVSKQSDQVLVQASVRVSNSGIQMVAMPSYAAQVQLKAVNLAVDAAASGSIPAYLAPQSSTVLNFNAVLPQGITPEELQLVLVEKKAKDAANAEKLLPIMVTDLDQAAKQDGIVAAQYQVGDNLKLQSSTLVNEQLDTALVDFHLYENETNGYKSAVAKFKLTNHGTSTIKLPEWSTELIGQDGLVYSGSLVKAASQEVAPNTSYMLTYTYLVPTAQEEQPFTLHIYDGKTATPAKITLGAFELHFLKDDTSGTYKVYPYEVNIKNFNVFYSMLNKTFVFEFKVDMEVHKLEQLLIDSATSKLQFDLVDTQNNVIATQSLTFDGIKNGSQTIKFTNDQVNQFSDMYRIKVYERIETGSGSVKRLLADLQATN